MAEMKEQVKIVGQQLIDLVQEDIYTKFLKNALIDFGVEFKFLVVFAFDALWNVINTFVYLVKTS